MQGAEDEEVLPNMHSHRPDFTRQERLVWELFFRGRHTKSSTIISTQKWKAISPSGLIDKKTVMRFYREATEEPYSFLYVRLEAKKPEDIFWVRFEHRLLDDHQIDV